MSEQWRFWFLYKSQLKDIEEYFGRSQPLRVITDGWYNRNCEYYTINRRRCEQIFNDDLRFVQEWRLGYKETMILDYKQDVEELHMKLSKKSNYIKPDILICRPWYG